MAPATESGVRDTVLQTKGLCMRFGGVVAVDGVDFTLRRRELRGLIGPNGAGKSTFFRCISGQYAPSAGEVWLAGQRVTGQPVHAIARAGVGIKTQVPQLMGGLSALKRPPKGLPAAVNLLARLTFNTSTCSADQRKYFACTPQISVRTLCTRETCPAH